MIRSKVIRRRLLAALLLYAFAIGSAFFWNDWQLDWIDMGSNLALATAGLILLHLRWRAREKKAMTPKQVRDIFS